VEATGFSGLQTIALRLHDFLGHEAGVTEADGFERRTGKHQPIGADASVDSGVELISAPGIV